MTFTMIKMKRMMMRRRKTKSKRKMLKWRVMTMKIMDSNKLPSKSLLSNKIKLKTIYCRIKNRLKIRLNKIFNKNLYQWIKIKIFMGLAWLMMKILKFKISRIRIINSKVQMIRISKVNQMIKKIIKTINEFIL